MIPLCVRLYSETSSRLTVPILCDSHEKHEFASGTWGHDFSASAIRASLTVLLSDLVVMGVMRPPKSGAVLGFTLEPR